MHCDTCFDTSSLLFDKKFEICTDLQTNNIANTYEDHITEQKLYWQGKNALLELKKLIFQSCFLSFLL